MPEWDGQQLKAIQDVPNARQLVSAGPGAGKSAVACSRIAHLIDKGVSPSRILLVSFTRTAVAELRDRIVLYAGSDGAARAVRISTIDSHAWSLRAGFDDRPFSNAVTAGSYDLNIENTVALFRERQPDLIGFMGRLEHLIIDEAQDVVGLRADLIIEMLKVLSRDCGVTILADPAQMIYGFTTDESDTNGIEPSFLDRLAAESSQQFVKRKIKKIHRVRDRVLLDVFHLTRKEVECAKNPKGHVSRVQEVIRKSCGSDIGVKSFEDLPKLLKTNGDESTLVLFRRRADVLIASSYCSGKGVEHRLRTSGLPVVMRPWLGWLLGETMDSVLSRARFDQIWEERAAICSTPFEGERRDDCWRLLHRLSAGRRAHTLDLGHLRNVAARSRPPVELCYPDFGSRGPILGTIHASKGREADTVLLVMSGNGTADDVDEAAVFEEGRVYYVGATRARKALLTASTRLSPVSYLGSGRVFKNCRKYRSVPLRVQLEVGRDGDVDKVAHLAWSNSREVQLILATMVGSSAAVEVRALPAMGYARRIYIKGNGGGADDEAEIGQLSKSFAADVRELWNKVDHNNMLRPGLVTPNVYVKAVGTIALTENERGALKPPFDQSGLALAPVVKGFPMIPFFRRRRGF